GRSGIELSADAAIDLYAAAGSTMARAISRGVHAATPADGDLFPVWSSR
ncbi:MAG: peptidase T4, partial [Mesorhizobium sp.]